MSLLDDVSIVVTPNGYKAGELYAVVPVPTEGAEEVTNGDFATDSDWVKGAGWTISGGNANSDGSGTAFLYQIISNVQTKRFLIEYEVKNYVSGSVSIVLGSAGSDQLTSSSNGVTSGIVVWDGTSDRLNFKSTSLNGSIDNVSVKEYTAADMDVTRATAATRVDEAGLVNYAEIVGSEEVTNGDFATDSDWNKSSGATISGGVASIVVTSGGYQFMSQSLTYVSGKSYIFKATVNGTSGKACTFFDAGGNNGGLSTSNGFVTFNGAEQVIDITFVANGNSNTILVSRNGSGDYTFTIDNVSVKEVTRDNVPRIDYTGGGCPHILAEPQRTNLIPYSEGFNSWLAKDYVTVTEDTSETTSPSGNNTASKITINSVSTIRRLYEVIITSSGNDYTFTVYAKKGTTDYIRFYLNSNMFDVSFDLTNGTKTVTLGSGSIESVGNDWYRLQATGTSSLTSEVPQIQLSNSASVNDYLYIWGAQLESGSFPTSYIPTSGSTVTRNQDQFTRDGIGSLINSAEGVLFVEAATTFDSSTSRRITLSDGSISNRVSLEFDDSVENKIKAFITLNGASQILEYTATDLSQFNKIAIKWKVNDFAIWFNGIKVATDSNGAVPTGLNELSFDDGQGGNTFYGKVKQLQVYKTALTDTQLAALTS